MKMLQRIGCLAALFVLMMWVPAALAAAPAAAYAGTQEPPHWHDLGFDAFHHPFDGLEMGLDLRLREIYARNIFSLDDEFGDSAGGGFKPGNWNQHQWQEYRTRWSTAWTMAPDVTLNTRLEWQFITVTSPSEHFTNTTSGSCGLGARDTDLREVMFDQLNIQWKNAFDAPMTLTVGRQDIILGTGWLVLEGTPANDGQDIFFDAVRDTINLRDTTTLDLIYIKQYDAEDQWLSPFNHREQLHLTQGVDQDGFIAYLTDKSIKDTQLEAYYIYKKDKRSSWADFWEPASSSVDSEIHTIGGRVAQNLDQNWSYSVEAAKQFGRRDEESMKGLGTNDRLTYAFNDDLKDELHLTYEYLSGDKPGTQGSEQFDTLWGDWPQSQRGSDLQSYLWTFEGRLGRVSNLHRVGIGHSFKPCAQWTLATDYNLLWADQNGTQQASLPFNTPAYSSNSYFRGQMLSGLVTYSCCKNFSTHFALDYFIPGNYYAESNRDPAVYARVNLEWTF
jgi:hypothetical protein